MVYIKKVFLVDKVASLIFGLYLLFISGVLILLLLISKLSPTFVILFSIFIVLIYLTLIYFVLFDKKVIFTSESITFRSFWRTTSIKWSDVKEIGVVYYSPYPVSGTANFFCVSTQTGTSGRMIREFSKDCIYLKYRKSLLPIFNNYWGKEMIGVTLSGER